MPGAYYNEIDPFAAQWLRNLISAGYIAPGDVDERSIEDVRPDELVGYTQCHFFAGIGVWSYALRRAGWPDERAVWTGSCPCQPFSSAGARTGFDDERHLWPAFFHLIEQCRPPVVAGEQVASKDADPWIDLVCADLGSLGYASGAVAFPSSSVGAPHIRDRLYWVAHAGQEQRGRRSSELGPGRQDKALGSEEAIFDQRRGEPGWVADAGRAGDERGGRPWQAHGTAGAPQGEARQRGRADAGDSVATSGLGHSEHQRPQGSGLTGSGEGVGEAWPQPTGAGADGRMGDTERDGLRSSGRAIADLADEPGDRPLRSGAASLPGPTNGFWRAADWLRCRDGKWRATEPGTFPLAHGAAGRVGRLRAYGNAINAEAARVFLECVMEAIEA